MRGDTAGPIPAQEALLLIAHGSARYPDAAAPLRRQAERLRTGTPPAEIAVGLLNGEPSVPAALAAITAATVRVVPFFMEAGYFTQVAIPRALGNDPRVRLCPPVGIHPAMGDVIAALGRAGCAALNLAPERAAVLVVGHGSASAPGRPLAMQAHARRLAACGRFGQVASACLEEPPLLPDALRDLRPWPVITVGFFAGEGMHVRDDVPRAIAAETEARGPNGPPVRLQGSVADHPSLSRIIRTQAGWETPEGDTTACSPM